MGGSTAGDFGNTKGSSLDALSNLLTAASLIPGIDTFADLASIPVDLARGDYISAGLSAIGVIPVIGEVGDTAKLARMADKAVDAAKVVDKASDIRKTLKLPKTPAKLKNNGWKETTPAAMKKNSVSRTFKKDGVTIRFDKGVKGAAGFRGKSHYHILNPKATGKHDYYLDIHGNPVPKNSRASHILP